MLRALMVGMRIGWVSNNELSGYQTASMLTYDGQDLGKSESWILTGI